MYYIIKDVIYFLHNVICTAQDFHPGHGMIQLDVCDYGIIQQKSGTTRSARWRWMGLSMRREGVVSAGKAANSVSGRGQYLCREFFEMSPTLSF